MNNEYIRSETIDRDIVAVEDIHITDEAEQIRRRNQLQQEQQTQLVQPKKRDCCYDCCNGDNKSNNDFWFWMWFWSNNDIDDNKSDKSDNTYCCKCDNDNNDYCECNCDGCDGCECDCDCDLDD